MKKKVNINEIDMMYLNELESFCKNYLDSEEAIKSSMYGGFYQYYRINIPLKKEFQIVINGIATTDGFVVNKKDDEIANYVYVQNIRSRKTVSKKEPLIISYTGWKNNLLKIIKDFKDSKNEFIVTFDKSSEKKLEEIWAIPMFDFDPFLLSLASTVRKYGKLSEAQETALQNVKKRYTPKVHLSENQLNFLKKLASLPGTVSDRDKKIISDAYAKACNGIPWTDTDRTEVSKILKEHNKL